MLRTIGKPLRFELRGLYSYRIGDYRAIYAIKDDILEILVTKCAYRKHVYE